jgi:hypothetical protein
MAVLGKLIVAAGAGALIVSFFLDFREGATGWELLERADIAFTAAGGVALLLALVGLIGGLRVPVVLAGVLCAVACGFFLSAFEPEDPEGLKVGYWVALAGSGAAALGAVLAAIGPRVVRRPVERPAREPPAREPPAREPPAREPPETATEALPPTGEASPPSGQPNWYPDPRGEKRLRYYDGRRWTDHVAD